MRTLAISVDAIPERWIFLLAGQSNMSGRASLTGLPAFEHADRVKAFSNAWSWQGGAEPVDSPFGQVDTVSLDIDAGVGPSMAFADALADAYPEIEVGLVPCAFGGSTLNAWGRNLSRSSLYGSMIARAQEAAKHGVIKGVIFYQGENDADTLDHAETWAARCYDLIDDIRSDLAIPALPFIVTVLGPDPGHPSFPYHAEVQASQEGMSGDGLAVVTAADLTGQIGDVIHLNTASQMVLGQRYATAMQAML
jgi:hypothetical protein